jgi:hypothetical protein
VSSGYLTRTLQSLLQRHPRSESLHAIIAATFLLCQRKITPAEKKKVTDAFDDRFSSKDLNEWIKVIEKELDDSKWFDNNPIERKSKSHEAKRAKLAEEFTGMGSMVQIFHSLTQIKRGDREDNYKEWKSSIMEQVVAIESGYVR